MFNPSSLNFRSSYLISGEEGEWWYSHLADSIPNEYVFFSITRSGNVRKRLSHEQVKRKVWENGNRPDLYKPEAFHYN